MYLSSFSNAAFFLHPDYYPESETSFFVFVNFSDKMKQSL